MSDMVTNVINIKVWLIAFHYIYVNEKELNEKK